jgi:hypothetical protein
MPPAPTTLKRLAHIALPVGAAALLLGGLAYLRIRYTLEAALEGAPAQRRALQFVALEPPRELPRFWSTGDIVGVLPAGAGLLTAGANGVQAPGEPRERWALPTLGIAAFGAWRGRPVAAPRAGGLYRRGEAAWEELRSGWGTLEVRTLLETDAGELLIGARQGLYRAAWGATSLERLDEQPVRALAQGPGFVLAGGERGLRRVSAGRSQTLVAPDPWIESVQLVQDELWLVTAAGLARGPVEGVLQPVAGAEDVLSGVWHDGAFLALSSATATVLRRLDAHGRGREEPLPAPTRRLLVLHDALLADTQAGLYLREPAGWRRLTTADEALPAKNSHVGALALDRERLAVGFFDGGLALAERATLVASADRPTPATALWQPVSGAAAWGVNALLSSGGALYVASLRGAARVDGERLASLPGAGAAFSLAATPNGVAVGYGQGVHVPGVGLLSAFHGLPGNQALALLPEPGESPSLFVATPSGLGSVQGRRVRFAVGAGAGKLPHPWVTSLALRGDVLYFGTYGNGLARRFPPRPGERDLAGRFEPFAETEGLKINTGCLVFDGDGRLWAGTDGRGLWRLAQDGARFAPVRVALPSPRVTALALDGGSLWVGTDEGLARLELARLP